MKWDNIDKKRKKKIITLLKRKIRITKINSIFGIN